jgi:predicted Zn-dependent protease
MRPTLPITPMFTNLFICWRKLRGAPPRWLAVAALIPALAACATNTITGRSQLALVSEEQAISGSASAYSNMIGQYSKKGKVIAGTPRAERIRDITNRLVAEAVRFRPDSASWSWQVQVIDEPKTVNAFCMAGGKMGIYSGLWEKLGATDDEIANVMGHEIGHALASHTREKMSVAMSTSVGAAVLAAIVSARGGGSGYDGTRSMIESAANVGVNLPNSREAESEADQIGIELAARAGFDPRAAVTLWQKMAKLSGGQGSEFLSTHPSPQNRIARLNELVAKVDPYYVEAKSRPANGIPDFLANANERRLDAPSREDYARKLAAEPQAMTFVADEFEKFKRGAAVLDCRSECAFSYASQKSGWKRLHDQGAWRDLAISVMKARYGNDFAYYLLAAAAQGMGLRDAANAYYSKAREAQADGRTCAGFPDTCEGIDVAQRIKAALAAR